MQEINGWLFPDDIDIPDQHWYEIVFKKKTVTDLDAEGHLYLARQMGLDHMNSEIVASGVGADVHYGAVRVELAFTPSSHDDVMTPTVAIGSTAASDTDIEHIWSVAETRAIKRAVKRALGIRSAQTDQSTDPDATPTADPEPSQTERTALAEHQKQQLMEDSEDSGGDW